MNFYSWHPVKYKIFYNLIFKAIKLTDLSFIKEVRYKIYQLLLGNWYPIQIIHEHWIKCYNILFIRGKRTSEVRIDMSNNKKPENNFEYRSLQYIEGLGERIGSIFRTQGFKSLRLALKPNNKISQFVHSMKDKVQKNREKDLIYKIMCSDCSKIYIGHTSMWLESRVYHHISNSKIDTKTNTALSLHLLENNHNANWDDIEILHRENKEKKRKVLESIYINKFDKLAMNNRFEVGNVGI